MKSVLIRWRALYIEIHSFRRTNVGSVVKIKSEIWSGAGAASVDGTVPSRILRSLAKFDEISQNKRMSLSYTVYYPLVLVLIDLLPK